MRTHFPIDPVVYWTNDTLRSTESKEITLGAMGWSGQAEYLHGFFTPWYVQYNGKKVKGGEVKNSGNLTFVTIDESGHTCPHDQPIGVLHVMTQWVAGNTKIV